MKLQLKLIRFSSTLAKNSKVTSDLNKIFRGIGSDITLLSGGFGLSGVPDTIIAAIESRSHIRNITAVSNNAGLEGRGLSRLLATGQITKMISSFIGSNKTFEKLYLTGQIEVELIPQGTLAEKIRAGGAGIPAFYTPTGVGTWLETGELPVQYDKSGTKILKTNKPREIREFNGKKYLMEEAIYGDVALIKAYKADTLGNCWFRGSSRNFNSVMGRNAKLTIVEAEHIVEPGEIVPEDVHLPGIYVDKVVQSVSSKDIEILKFSNDQPDRETKSLDEYEIKREKIARRLSKEFKNGLSANLGIGIPTLAPKFLPLDVNVLFQSENGILGLGPYPKKGEEDADLINAGKETTTLLPGASLFGSEESFSMIRSGRLDLSILGGLQVAENGDLANWGLPGRVKGMGGAMDLVANSEKTRVIAVMEHVDKKGRPKILKKCVFPLTGTKCVSRIITDLAVFDVIDEKLVLVEVEADSTVEEIRHKTGASFSVSPNVKHVAF